MDVVFTVCIVTRGAVGSRVSSCRCCMFVSCVHHIAVLNAEFCMTCSLLILVEYARGDHMEEATIWKRRPYGRGDHMEEAYSSSKKTQPARGWNATVICTNCFYSTLPPEMGPESVFWASRPSLLPHG